MQHDAQRDLPLASIEEADAAYVAAVDDLERFAGLPRRPADVLREIIRRGRRDLIVGTMVWKHGSRRNGAKAAGLPPNSFSRAVNRLVMSRLVSESDGALRLVLPRLVEVAEEARARAAPELYGQGFDAADALRSLSPGGKRAALIHGDPRCSTGARTVYKEINTPVPSPLNTKDGNGVRARVERAARDGSPRAGAARPRALLHEPAWQRLQIGDFRPRLNLVALRAAFDAAVRLRLLFDYQDNWQRFLATAFDLANDPPRPGHEGIRSPLAVLRDRVERGTCYRQSDRATAWAKEQLRDPAMAREPDEAAATTHHSPLT